MDLPSDYKIDKDSVLEPKIFEDKANYSNTREEGKRNSLKLAHSVC